MILLNGCAHDARSIVKVLPKQITLTQNNFVFVQSSYLNVQQYSSPDCGKKTCYSGSETFDCPKPDLLMLYIKILNLNTGVTTYSPKYQDLLVCDVHGGERDYENQHFHTNEQTGIAELGLENMDYSKSHNLLVCCKISETEVTSNDICLPLIKIGSLC